VRGAGIAHDDVGKSLTFDFTQQVGAVQTTEIIQTVGILQLNHLRRKDEIRKFLSADPYPPFPGSRLLLCPDGSRNPLMA